MIRMLHLNPVEPATISARTPKGFDMVMDLLYRTAIDEVWPFDLAATLVLEGRTTGQAQTYLVAGTDTVNGKAQVRVPGGDLVDGNGYRMTLVGTVDGVRKVVGVGTLILAGTGIEEVVAADMIDTVDLVLDYDEVCELDVALWQDAAGGTPFDLTAESTSVGAAIYDAQGGSALMPFTVTVLDTNKVQLSLTVAPGERAARARLVVAGRLARPPASPRSPNGKRHRQSASSTPPLRHLDVLSYVTASPTRSPRRPPARSSTANYALDVLVAWTPTTATHSDARPAHRRRHRSSDRRHHLVGAVDVEKVATYYAF
jgi:hypothetical protein